MTGPDDYVVAGFGAGAEFPGPPRADARPLPADVSADDLQVTMRLLRSVRRLQLTEAEALAQRLIQVVLEAGEDVLPPQLVRAAERRAALRTWLLSTGYLTNETLAQLRGSTANAARVFVTREREANRICTVKHARTRGIAQSLSPGSRSCARTRPTSRSTSRTRRATSPGSTPMSTALMQRARAQGNTRFAPFPDQHTGLAVPTLYLADDLPAALLETVFHNVPSTPPKGMPGVVVPWRDLAGKAHVSMTPPRAVRLVDLRDAALSALNISRAEIVASSAEHYPCTRTVAQLLHGSTHGPSTEPFDGIVWHSRQAEIRRIPPVEVLVVFADRVPADRDAGWAQPPAAGSFGSPLEGTGYQRVLEVADLLGATIEES